MKKVLYSLMIAASLMGSAGMATADGATTYCCSCPPWMPGC